MTRTCTWAALTILTLAGCQSNSASPGRLPGDSGSSAPADNAAGTDAARPSERPQRMGGTGDNGDQLPMNGLH